MLLGAFETSTAAALAYDLHSISVRGLRCTTTNFPIANYRELVSAHLLPADYVAPFHVRVDAVVYT